MTNIVTLKKSIMRFGITAIACIMAALLVAWVPQAAQAAYAADLPALKQGEVRIHVLPFDNTNAIIVECDGHFGIVDSGEDSLSPDGSDPKYPQRPGTTIGWGREAEVIAYMKKIGVTKENLDFYIGTHPHSDHIGSAPQIIEEFHPKTIYCPEYDDKLITSQSNLWDNQWVYNRLLAAVAWAQGEEGYGAKFIQHLDPNWVEPKPKPDPKPDPDPEDPEKPDQPKDPDPEKPENPDKPKDPDPTKPDPENPNPGTGEGDNKGDNTGEGDGTGSGGAGTGEGTGGTGTGSGTGSGESGSGTGEGGGSGTGESGGGSGTGESGGGEGGGSGSGSGTGESGGGSGEEEEDPKPGKPNTGSPFFKLGSAQIEIVNYDETYLTTKTSDCNNFSYGVKVTATNGRVAFLAGDMNNSLSADTNGIGDEDLVAKTLGKVDFFALAHHGYPGSNTPGYLNSILKQAKENDRAVAVQSGYFSNIPQESVKVFTEKGTRLFQSASALKRGQDAFVADLTQAGVRTNADGDTAITVQTTKDAPYAFLYKDGMPFKATGWHKTDDGKLYYFGEDNSTGSTSALSNVWATYEGHPVYLNEYGQMSADWIKIDSKWYLFDPSGKRLSGWQKKNNKWYYLDSEGAMQTGWMKARGKWYFLDSVNGDMKTGWFMAEGKPYCANDNGEMLSGNGWVKYDNLWGYVTPSGALKTGWIKTGGKWYFLETSGIMATGWKQVDGTWYYLNSNGDMKTGWVKSNNEWFYMSKSGAMSTGWVKTGGKWYYLESDGVMATGKKVVDGVSYFLTDSGAMKTGWLHNGADWYYYDKSGAMKTSSWVKSSGKWYYLDSAGEMVTGTHTIDGKTYTFSPSGAMR